MSTTKRPELQPENWRELEQYYLYRQPTPRRSLIFARLLATAFRPKIHYLNPDVPNQLAETAPGTLKSIAPNHISATDPEVVASFLYRTPATRPLLRNGGVPTKSDVIGYPSVGGVGVEAIGAYINWGIRDLKVAPYWDFNYKQLTQAGQNLYETLKISNDKLNIFNMRHRDGFLVFSSATRGDEPEIVEPPKDGYARGILEVIGERPIDTHPVGIYYGEGVNPHKFSPTTMNPVLVVGPAIRRYSSEIAEINGELHAAQTACLDRAIELSRG